MRSGIRFFLALCFVACLFQTGHADLYSFTGQLSTAQGELVTDSGWSANGVVLTFEVNQLSDGKWSYKYTFTTNSEAPLSVGLANPGSGQKPFLKLLTSNVAGSTYSLVTSNGTVPMSVITNDPGFTLWNDTTAGRFMAYEPHLKVGGDTDTIGIAAISDGVVEIISSQAPMWGEFYLRGYSISGANTQPEVVNRGLNDGVFPSPSGGSWYGSVGGAPVFDPDAYNPNATMYWILVPDTRTNFNTPIPAAAWLLGSGLIGLIGLRRFRKK